MKNILLNGTGEETAWENVVNPGSFNAWHFHGKEENAHFCCHARFSDCRHLSKHFDLKGCTWGGQALKFLVMLHQGKGAETEQPPTLLPSSFRPARRHKDENKHGHWSTREHLRGFKNSETFIYVSKILKFKRLLCLLLSEFSSTELIYINRRLLGKPIKNSLQPQQTPGIVHKWSFLLIIYLFIYSSPQGKTGLRPGLFFLVQRLNFTKTPSSKLSSTW